MRRPYFGIIGSSVPWCTTKQNRAGWCMKYISKLKSGYIVRKSKNGIQHQQFFSSAKAGSMEQALMQARAYRDQLVEKLSGGHSYQSENWLNNTGWVGVAMHCRTVSHKPDSVVHFFRAQVPLPDGKSKSRSWAVRRYGLLPAYTHAVQWRLAETGKPAASDQEIETCFASKFLPLYMKFARDESEAAERQALMGSLQELYSATDSPTIKRLLRDGRVC